jgi:hypothetical protein
MKLTQTLFTAAVISCFAFTASAQNIASWEISGVDLNDGSYDSSFTLNAQNKDTNLTTAELTLGSGVNSSTSNNQYGFKVGGGNEQTTLSGAITNAHYIEFKFVVAGGYEFNLSSINFKGESSASGADNVAFMSDVDGFTSGNEISALSGMSGSTGGFDTDSSGFGAGTISLAAAKYQNLSAITFRLYGWNTSSGSGVTYLRNLSGDDVVLNGVITVIPEPNTYALLAGFCALGFVMVRRRSIK